MDYSPWRDPAHPDHPGNTLLYLIMNVDVYYMQFL